MERERMLRHIDKKNYFGRPNPIWHDPLPDNSKRFREMEERRKNGHKKPRLTIDSVTTKNPSNTSGSEKRAETQRPQSRVRPEPVRNPQEAAEAHKNRMNYDAGRRKPITETELNAINRHRRELGLQDTTVDAINAHKGRRDTETGGFRNTRWT